MKRTTSARDLTIDEPRALGVELDGYAHLPRMLDKARATLAGTAGGYLFGCPVDHTCMARLGIAPELVLELAAEHDDDERVLEALREHGIPSAREAWFDAVAVEDELQEQGTYLHVRPSEPVELTPGETRPARTDAEPQVWIVQDGEATFFLGELQARIVRAGQAVSIPAGVEWRCENRGDGVLRALTASSR